jgi:sugar-specific transcriptional regulator TrmB/DNA-binding CsgD family transcriptional regulator
MALRDLGFSPNEERIYRALLSHPQADLATLAELVALDDQQVRLGLDALAEFGVIRLDTTGVTILPPSLSLGRLVERTEDDLMARYRNVSGTRSELAAFDSSFHPVESLQVIDNGVERVEGLDAVRERIDELSFFSRSSVYAIQPGGPQSKAALEASRPLDLRAARRKIRMRVIHESSVLGDELNRVHLRELMLLGAEARFNDGPLERMLILDEQVAVVPIEPGNSRRGALIVRHPGLLAGLLDLFNRTWTGAQEFPVDLDPEAAAEAVETHEEITDQDRRVLVMLATGCTDETAAREVGVSVRHLRRRISRLMLLLNANSRFEAGVEAARRGWL